MSLPRAETGTARSIVLVVDDTPDTLRLLIEALEGAGMMTLVARDGATALDLLQRIEPDLILLDAVMPGIDGFETCRRIKRRPEMATTPVVFMTGLADRAHVAEALRAGGVDYVSKPVAPDELIARISVHVVNARLIADARRALDATGRAVAALAPDGATVWASPRARAMLATLQANPIAGAALGAWVASMADEALSEGSELRLPAGAGELRLSPVGRSAGGDLLVRVASETGGDQRQRLAAALGVSEREAEVLEWLARGKSNRDIATILGLSPRTVTKHVEQIFAKLGVENRTAAAAIAIRAVDGD